MNSYDRQHLLAERQFLHTQLAKLPVSARLTRMSDEARLSTIEAQLAKLSAVDNEPSPVRLTFNGAPVIASHGIFADFGMKATSSFTDAIATVAASLVTPLSPMGPSPSRDQNQLLITNTAVGSFGFELEEYNGIQQSLCAESPVSIALDRTYALLQSTLENDDDLADIASETDPRALDKIRNFLKVLADNDAVFTLQYKGRGVRFTDVGQIRNSLQKLSTDNLHESAQRLSGHFVGALPVSRTFEFNVTESQQIIRGKISPVIQDVNEINDHLHQLTSINVMTTQVGNGRPRFFLQQLPECNNISNANKFHCSFLSLMHLNGQPTILPIASNLGGGG